MQYEIVFKSDRWCSCYTCLPQSAPAAQSVLRKMVPGTPPKDQRLLTIATPIQVQHIHIHANKAKTKKQYNITQKQQQNRARTILHITTIVWT